MTHGIPAYPRARGRVIEEQDTPIAPEWLDEAIIRLKRELSDFAGLVADTAKRVDEFQAMPLSGESLSVLTLQPDYDVYPEIIEAVLVTGPANTVCTINLGKRNWTLNTSAQGLVVIAPIKASLDRDDIRQLSSATAGLWTLELMGYADVRYRYK